jgi:hypothetical protein
LFFGEISALDVYHGFPVRFKQTICRLTTSRSGQDVGIVVNEVVPNTLSEQFGITIRTEAASIGSSVGFEVAKGQENGVTLKVLHAIYPGVASCPVNKDERITKSPH